jgi:hypothetical protein
MKNWTTNAWIDCPWKKQSITELLVEEANIIVKNDTLMLDVVGYFNVDHELTWWIWRLTKILLKFLKSLFTLTKFLLVLALVARCSGQLNYPFLMIHGTMSWFNSQFKILIKCDISL